MVDCHSDRPLVDRPHLLQHIYAALLPVCCSQLQQLCRQLSLLAHAYQVLQADGWIPKGHVQAAEEAMNG